MMNGTTIDFTFFVIRRSTYLAYFKAEWDFIKNLTFFHASQVPPDAAKKKSVLCLISLVKKRDHLSLSLSGDLQCMAVHLRAQEVLPSLQKRGKEVTLA